MDENWPEIWKKIVENHRKLGKNLIKMSEQKQNIG